MNHIDEGLKILTLIYATPLAKRAYCLHPLVQDGVPIEHQLFEDSYVLACEYRDRANSYLCLPENDWITKASYLRTVVGSMSEDCRLMLVADKTQNLRDFLKYHAATHPRATQLKRYFSIWLEYLTCETPAFDNTH